MVSWETLTVGGSVLSVQQSDLSGIGSALRMNRRALTGGWSMLTVDPSMPTEMGSAVTEKGSASTKNQSNLTDFWSNWAGGR